MIPGAPDRADDGSTDRSADDLEDALRGEAERLGFDLFGIAGPEPSAHMAFYRTWIDRGLHGEMGYLERVDAVERRADPAANLPGVRSIVVVGHEYSGGHERWTTDQAVIARYARGRDYHGVVREGLEALRRWLCDRVGPQVRSWGCVDTAPVLERDLARRAGLGWFGRNTMLIHPRRGSYFVLGALMLSVELKPSEPFDADRCGSCRACLDACPTGALLGRDEAGAPVMDARRCISYLTIESKGPIPHELRPAIGNRVFGCDICQEVCPWNQRFGDRPGAAHDRGAHAGESLVTWADRLLAMSEKAFQREYADSPLARPRRKGLLRNIVVGIGNAITTADEPGPMLEALVRATHDPQPLVRSHAAWALGRLLHAGAATSSGRAYASPARQRLEEWAETELDPHVLVEIQRSLGRPTPTSEP